MRKVLIIDDEKLIREGLKTYIDWAALDLEVCAVCSDGEQGLAAVSEHLPSIVIADIFMPNMSGLEMLKKIRELRIESEIIFISAYSDFSYAQEALKLGAFDYLLKPIESEVLFASLSRCIEKINTPHTGIIKSVTAEDTQAFFSGLQDVIKNLDKSCDIDTIKRFSVQERRLPIKCIQYLRKADLSYIFAKFFIFCRDSLHFGEHMDFALESIHFFENIFSQLEQYYGKPLYGCRDMQYYISRLRSASGIPDLYLKIIETVSEIFSELQTKSMNPHAKEALQIIMRNYNNEISLKTVADELHITASHLSALFKSGTGYSFTEYVYRFRMNKAHELLKTKKYKVYEIAAAVGYQDFVQFSKRFKKFFGYSPKQWGVTFHEN